MFSTMLFVFGFGIQNIIFGFTESSCTDFSIVFISHIGLLGLFGWLPSILAALYIPSIA